MPEHHVRDFLHTPPLDGGEVLNMIPIEPKRLCLCRLDTRDIDGAGYELLEYLIASADWHGPNGFRCEGTMPPVADVVTVTELDAATVRGALYALRGRRAVAITSGSATEPFGRYRIDLWHVPARTTAALERLQVESRTIRLEGAA